MDATEEIIVYDALAAMRENSAALAALVNRCGTDAEKKAYKSGVYAPCIKLQCVLGTEALKHGEERHAQIKRKAEAYFANMQRVLRRHPKAIANRWPEGWVIFDPSKPAGSRVISPVCATPAQAWASAAEGLR